MAYIREDDELEKINDQLNVEMLKPWTVETQNVIEGLRHQHEERIKEYRTKESADRCYDIAGATNVQSLDRNMESIWMDGMIEADGLVDLGAEGSTNTGGIEFGRQLLESALQWNRNATAARRTMAAAGYAYVFAEEKKTQERLMCETCALPEGLPQHWLNAAEQKRLNHERLYAAGQPLTAAS